MRKTKMFLTLVMSVVALSASAQISSNQDSSLPEKERTSTRTKSANYLLESELEWENPAPGITRQVMGYDGQIMLVKVVFEAGAVGTPHMHYHSQVTYVASGKFEIEIEGQKKVLQAGDGFYVDPDGNHGAVCLEAGTLVDVFSPMRADFLK